MTEDERPPFMRSVQGCDTEALLEPWRWILPRDLTPLLVSYFGDWVFGAPDGSLWALSVLDAHLRRVAVDSAEFNRLKKSVHWLEKEFIHGWYEIAVHHGFRPNEAQCVGWRLPPVMGGPFAVTNLQLFDLSVYQHIMGQLLDQLRART